MAETKHGTLAVGGTVTATVDTTFRGLVITNRTPGSELWVRFGGAAPAAEGTDSYLVLGSRLFDKRGSVTARLLAPQGCQYSVEAA